MALTLDEIKSRAHERARLERLHVWSLCNGEYLVKSRELNPGTFHTCVTDDAGNVTRCKDCPGFMRWGFCVHAAATERRLAREGKRAKAQPAVTVQSAPLDDAPVPSRRAQQEQDASTVDRTRITRNSFLRPVA